MADERIPITQVNGILRPCCGDERNLQALQPNTPEHRHGMIVKQCRRCGRKHYELHADPGQFGLLGGRL